MSCGIITVIQINLIELTTLDSTTATVLVKSVAMWSIGAGLVQSRSGATKVKYQCRLIEDVKKSCRMTKERKQSSCPLGP